MPAKIRALILLAALAGTMLLAGVSAAWAQGGSPPPCGEKL